MKNTMALLPREWETLNELQKSKISINERLVQFQRYISQGKDLLLQKYLVQKVESLTKENFETAMLICQAFIQGNLVDHISDDIWITLLDYQPDPKIWTQMAELLVKNKTDAIDLEVEKSRRFAALACEGGGNDKLAAALWKELADVYRTNSKLPKRNIVEAINCYTNAMILLGKGEDAQRLWQELNELKNSLVIMTMKEDPRQDIYQHSFDYAFLRALKKLLFKFEKVMPKRTEEAAEQSPDTQELSSCLVS